MRKILFGLAAIPLAVAGCSTGHTTPPVNTVTNSVSSTGTATQTPNQPVTNENQTAQPPANNSQIAQGSAQFGATSYQNVYVVEKSVKNKTEDISYPQIAGLADLEVQGRINSLLKTESTQTPAAANGEPGTAYQYNGWYSVPMQRGSIIEFMLFGYYYPDGAAHGMPSQQTTDRSDRCK